MNNRLTEADLEKIFISSRRRRRNPLKVFLSFFLLFLLFFATFYFALNFSAISQQIFFWYHDEFSTNKSDQLTKVVLSGSDATGQSSSIPNISDNSLYIESIDVRAPITFRVSNNENDVSKNLKNGLIHIAGTSLPGERGNIFITGHSSNFPWVRSYYNSVFALLNKVVVGDLILIKFQNTNYVYQVTEIFVTSSSDSTVMDPYFNDPTLTLMTCTPLGTNLKRLIVRANQILPSPASARSSSGAAGNKNLPEGVH